MTESMSYMFSFIPPRIILKEIDDAMFTEIHMPGCIGLGRELGDPTLPVKFVQLLLPPQKTVDSITITGSPVELKFPGIDLTRECVYPAQKEIPMNTVSSSEVILNQKVYSSHQFYPELPYREYHIGNAHGYTILNIGLLPIRLIPAEGRIFYYPDLTMTVSLRKNETLNPLFRGTPEDEAWVKNLVCNPEMTKRYTGLPTFEYPGGLCDPSDEYAYVIITTEQNSLDYWETTANIPYNWESLMQQHTMEGLSCILVTKQAIDACPEYYNATPLFNDSQAHIREFCKDAYEDWNTDYILIGADAEFIAPRLMDYAYEPDVDADLYWSNLDNSFNADLDPYWGEEGDTGFDLYSELFLGRIPCDIPQDVSNWLTKSFYYADATDADYLENAGFYAYNSSGPPGTVEMDDIIDFAAIKGTDYWCGPNPDPWPGWLGFLYGFETWNSLHPDNAFNLSVRWTDCDPNPGWQYGEIVPQFRQAINTDLVTLITGIGHGDPEMSLDVSASDWEILYHNTKPFFINDLGNHCGDMDATDDGVLHSMLFHSDTALAFGCIYNSGYAWVGSISCTNSSTALQTKLFWDYFFDITNNSGGCQNWQCGKGFAWSKDFLAPTLNWGSTWRAVLQSRLLFADPAQLLKPPHPNRPPEIRIMSWSPDTGLTMMARDPEGDDVFYMVNWGDGTSIEWVGPYLSGEEVSLMHTYGTPGVYEIKGKVKDIHNAVSNWSDPLLVEIQGPEITIETLRGGLGLTMTMTNIGGMNASNVKWTITLVGGLILYGKEKSGTFERLPIGEAQSVRSFILGLGKTAVSVQVNCEEGTTVEKTVHGLMFGVFVFLVP
jgi:hypothetical protein